MTATRTLCLQRSLMSLACILFLSHSPYPCPLRAQDHDTDAGSAGAADIARSAVSNYVEGIFSELPDSLRLKLIRELEEAYQKNESRDGRGKKLLYIANQLMVNNFPSQANQLYREVARDTALPAQVRSQAWIRAGEIAPVFGTTDDGVACFQKAVALIDKIPEDDRTWTDSYTHLASLAKLANKLYCSEFNSPELPHLYRRILDYEPMFGTYDPARFMTMALDASRVLRERNDLQEASIYLRLAEQYLEKDGSLTPAEKISIKIETTSGLYSWNDRARIEKLKDMWKDDSLSKDPAIMRIGNEILWALFLKRKQERAVFESFAQEFKRRGAEFMKSLDEEASSDVSIFSSQGIVALAFSNSETSDFGKVKELREQYCEMRSGERVVGRFPSSASRDDIRTMAAAFRSTVEDLFELKVEEPVPDPDEE